MPTSRKFRDSIHAKGTNIAVLSNGNSDDYISPDGYCGAIRAMHQMM